MKTTNVKIRGIRQNKSSKKPSYEIRWKTGREPHSTTRSTKALAESFQSDLRQAAKRGEESDTATGLPDSMTEPDPEPEPEKPRTFLTLSREFVARQWPHAAAKTRDGLTDALATVIPALTLEIPGAPKSKALRAALRGHILLPRLASGPSRPLRLRRHSSGWSPLPCPSPASMKPGSCCPPWTRSP